VADELTALEEAMLQMSSGALRQSRHSELKGGPRDRHSMRRLNSSRSAGRSGRSSRSNRLENGSTRSMLHSALASTAELSANERGSDSAAVGSINAATNSPSPAVVRTHVSTPRLSPDTPAGVGAASEGGRRALRVATTDEDMTSIHATSEHE